MAPEKFKLEQPLGQEKNIMRERARQIDKEVALRGTWRDEERVNKPASEYYGKVRRKLAQEQELKEPPQERKLVFSPEQEREIDIIFTMVKFALEQQSGQKVTPALADQIENKVGSYQSDSRYRQLIGRQLFYEKRPKEEVVREFAEQWIGFGEV